MPAKINLLNQTFGKLTVIEETKERQNNSVVWKCQCECGNIIKLSTKELRSDGIIQCRSCGLNREPKIQNSYIGQQYGVFTILEKTNKRQGNKILYKCKCKCGNIIESTITDIKSGKRKSCGCLNSKYHIGDIINNRQILEKITINSKHPKFKAKCLLCGREYEVLGQTIDKTISCGCQKSIGEFNIIQILKQNKIKYQKEYCFPKSKLRFDFAIFNENNQIIRLIEFDGEQHYKENIKNSGWNTYEKYEYTLKNDLLKNQIAKENNIPLIRIPYWERDNITLTLLFGNKYLIT